MKVFSIASMTLCAALVGCMNESQPGGPGAKPSNSPDVSRPAPRDTRVTDKDNTFKLVVPGTETDLKQGEREDVTVAIDRGDTFKQNVKLEFKPPKGLSVTPKDALIGSGNKEVKVTVEAAPDATPGETTIEVIAVPESGKSVSMQMSVEVKKS